MGWSSVAISVVRLSSAFSVAGAAVHGFASSTAGGFIFESGAAARAGWVVTSSLTRTEGMVRSTAEEAVESIVDAAVAAASCGGVSRTRV